MYPLNDPHLISRAIEIQNSLKSKRKFVKEDFDLAVEIVKSENPDMLQDIHFWNLVENILITKRRNVRISDILDLD